MEQEGAACLARVRKLNEEQLDLVQKLRLLGNSLFKADEYRGAALLYRTGLGLMGLDPTSLPAYQIVHPDKFPDFHLPEPVAMQAVSLLLNLAQTLLNMPARHMQVELAAMEALLVCERAEVHLLSLTKLNGTTVEDMLSLMHEEKCPPKIGRLCALWCKSRSRMGTALERCGNFSGALHNFESTDVPVEEEQLERLQEILEGFHSWRTVVAVPHVALNALAQPPDCCHRAHVDFVAMNHSALTRNESLGSMARGIACGPYMNGAWFLISYTSSILGPSFRGYSVGQWRQLGDRVGMDILGLFETDKKWNLDRGAVVGGTLYCLAPEEGQPTVQVFGADLCCDDGVIDGFKVHMEVKALDVSEAGLVVSCGAIYQFGGLIRSLEGKLGQARIASFNLLVFTPGPEGDTMDCTVARTVNGPPPARWGHATFADGTFIYIFGGMFEEINVQESKTREQYCDDLWRYNIETGEWTYLQPLGLRPCKRASMGVAADGDRAIIVGGVTQTPRNRKLWLADVWEFDFKHCCWIQVVAENALGEPWFSARSHAACGLVGGNTLTIVGGVGPKGPVGHDFMVRLTITRGKGRRLAADIAAPGSWRDEAVEHACALMSIAKRNISDLPKDVQRLYREPEGSVMVYDINLFYRLPLLADVIYDLPYSGEPAYNIYIPKDKIFSAESYQPLRPLGDEPDNIWGSAESPFDLAPRWLGPPNEVSFSLTSKSSQRGVSLRDKVDAFYQMRQTVKQFPTAKAAVEYFRLCQPHGQLANNWRRVQEPNIEENLGPNGELMDEWSVYANTDIGGGKHQGYVMAVYGHTFACTLASRSWHADHRDASHTSVFCQYLLKAQASMLMAETAAINEGCLPPCCQWCGNPNSPPSLPATCRRTTNRVCKGCRMVRYCSAKCQQADWSRPGGHKAVCRKFATGHG